MAERKRTKKGNVTASARRKSATLSGGRFPIFDAKSAKSALRLRGHAGKPGSAARKKVVARAARFAPAAARAARDRDRKASR